MHFVTGSAAIASEDRRRSTALRISGCAQQLTDEHGLDGFTMEDLAAVAAVSRRTLFNYFPGKIDAVLGEGPVLSPAALDVFRAGGPHHDLVEDLVELAQEMFTDKELDQERVALHRRILRANPRLMASAMERFELLSEHLVAEILTREGPTFDAHRARVAIRVLSALFEVSLDEFLTDTRERELADLFTDSLRTARELLA
jgi:AcrR family transcriptional regulator